MHSEISGPLQAKTFYLAVQRDQLVRDPKTMPGIGLNQPVGLAFLLRIEVVVAEITAVSAFFGTIQAK